MRKLIPLLVALAGCQQVPMLPGLKPYRMDIQQGNYVTQDMVAKLKPGMTRSQVRFVLGTPLVADPFHSDRWDYIYVLQKRGNVVEHRRIIVHFSDDKLARIEGDVVPAAGATGAAALPQTPPSQPSRAAPDKAPASDRPAASPSLSVPEKAAQ